MAGFVGPHEPDWTDMSRHVVHFTKDSESEPAYRNLLSILATRRIEARNPFGIARDQAPSRESQRAVCFSEVPLHLLSRIAARRSEYGLGFSKDFVVHRGGAPIFYAYKDSLPEQALRELIQSAGADESAPIWNVTPYVDAPGNYGGKDYFFEWEREWRINKEFRFSPEDVAFVIAPEGGHQKIENLFAKIRKATKITYDCPLVDARWKQKELKPLLKSII